MRIRMILNVVAVAVAFQANAAPLKKMQMSPRELKRIQRYHDKLNLNPPKNDQAVPLRPFSELERAGYLLMSSDYDFNSREAKRTMAKNLSEDVTLVLYTSNVSDRARLIADFDDVISPDRIRVIQLKQTERGFWSRDGLPVPVWAEGYRLAFTDAKYYHRFEPDAEIGKLFGLNVLTNSYYFEGGNFMPNDQGVCLTVDNSRSSKMPDTILRNLYGCKTLLRLPFEKGIGHVDESARFANTMTVLTDSAGYAQRIRAAGLEAVQLPRPQKEYETYVNSLLVNDVMFVPIFKEPNDEAALNIYRRFGFKVVGIPTNSLANDGLGSLHCITMTYPPMPFADLLSKLGASEIR